MHRLKVILILALMVVAFVVDAHALVLMDFEGLPLDYYTYDEDISVGAPACVNDDHLNLGYYYPGVYFGSDVTINDKDIYGYNWPVYPPMSGSSVIVSRLVDGSEIIFDNPTTYFEGWFTHMNGFGLDINAYDINGVQVDTAHISYWDAHLARLNRGEMVKISLSAPSIKRVYIAGSANCWAGDNIAYESNGTPPVPKPATMALFALGLGGIVIRKKFMIFRQ